MVLTTVVAMLLTARAVVVVSVGCFPFNAVAMSPIPVKVMLLVALSVVAATEDTFRAELVVSAACFPEMVVLMSTPAR